MKTLFYFFQARLEDYSPEYLRPRTHVSFHKHWQNDPYKVYDYLLKEPVEEPVTQEEIRDELWWKWKYIFLYTNINYINFIWNK